MRSARDGVIDKAESVVRKYIVLLYHMQQNPQESIEIDMGYEIQELVNAVSVLADERIKKKLPKKK